MFLNSENKGSRIGQWLLLLNDICKLNISLNTIEQTILANILNILGFHDKIK